MNLRISWRTVIERKTLERPPEIFVPEEVRPLYLVTLPANASPVYTQARNQFGQYQEFSYRTLLMQAEMLYQDAWGASDRHVSALARLYQADLFERLGKRDQALSAARMSAKWLALRIPVRARYQEAVARYFMGVLAYLQDDPKTAMRALNTAANLLVQTRRTWRFSGGHPQLAHCERLQRWIADLLALRVEAWRQPNIVILPVYRRLLEDDRVELDGATAVDWRRLLPEDAANGERATWPIRLEPSEDEMPSAEMVYFAVRREKSQRKTPRRPSNATVETWFYVETGPPEAQSADRMPFEFITGEKHGRRIIGHEEK